MTECEVCDGRAWLWGDERRNGCRGFCSSCPGTASTYRCDVPGSPIMFYLGAGKARLDLEPGDTEVNGMLIRGPTTMIITGDVTIRCAVRFSVRLRSIQP